MQEFRQNLQGLFAPFTLILHMTSNRDETPSPTDGNIPATVQITKSMKRKNDSIPKQHDKEDLGFLDDRIQLLDTVRQMIDIELERRGVMSEGNPHPENHPPEHAGREPPRSGQTHSPPTQSNQPNSKQRRHTFWQRLVSLFSLCL